MIRTMVAIALMSVLAGCALASKPAPIGVSIDGPKFPRSQFDCGSRPLPPDPATATGKTAALHENRLGSWGEGCQGRLQSTGLALEAAGQLIDGGKVP
jgi:hypothetical protein